MSNAAAPPIRGDKTATAESNQHYRYWHRDTCPSRQCPTLSSRLLLYHTALVVASPIIRYFPAPCTRAALSVYTLFSTYHICDTCWKEGCVRPVRRGLTVWMKGIYPRRPTRPLVSQVRRGAVGARPLDSPPLCRCPRDSFTQRHSADRARYSAVRPSPFHLCTPLFQPNKTPPHFVDNFAAAAAQRFRGLLCFPAAFFSCGASAQICGSFFLGVRAPCEVRIPSAPLRCCPPLANCPQTPP